MENRKVERNPDEVFLVAMFPWFAFGHIYPFIHLSNKLSSHGIRISFLSASGNIPRIKQALNQSPNTEVIPLHIPPVEGLPPGLDSTSDMTDASMAELLKLALDQMEPQIRTLLSDLKPQVVFFDFAQHWLPNLASELGIKTVHFSVFSAITASYIVVPSRINSIIKKEPAAEGKTAKIAVPTIEEFKRPPEGYPKAFPLKTFEAESTLYVYKSFYGGPPAVMRYYDSMQGSDAMAFKSCNEVEGPYVEYIKTQIGKPVILAGLTLPEPPSDVLEPKFARWLERFPPKSVVFCSFGSESFLDDDQIKELALGLEMSGLPFFLVLNFLDRSDHGRLEQALPSGFMERVRDRGMVHTGWVQQQQMLAHESVGCYVSHCGFGSLIEAIVGNCQLVLLPLKGDQFFNSRLFCLDLKVGVEVNRRDGDGYFGKFDVLQAVKMVMVEDDKEPGKSIRANQIKWRKYLMNREVQDKYICDLIRDLKTLTRKDKHGV